MLLPLFIPLLAILLIDLTRLWLKYRESKENTYRWVNLFKQLLRLQPTSTTGAGTGVEEEVPVDHMTMARMRLETEEARHKMEMALWNTRVRQQEMLNKLTDFDRRHPNAFTEFDKLCRTGSDKDVDDTSKETAIPPGQEAECLRRTVDEAIRRYLANSNTRVDGTRATIDGHRWRLVFDVREVEPARQEPATEPVEGLKVRYPLHPDECLPGLTADEAFKRMNETPYSVGIDPYAKEDVPGIGGESFVLKFPASSFGYPGARGQKVIPAFNGQWAPSQFDVEKETYTQWYERNGFTPWYPGHPGKRNFVELTPNEHIECVNDEIRDLKEQGRIPNAELISDGWHTFKELYDMRLALTVATLRNHIVAHKETFTKMHGSWAAWINPTFRSHLHADGTMFEGMFIVGVYDEISDKCTISFHYDNEHWDKFHFAQELEKAPEWDGHTDIEVMERLLKL